MCTSVTLGLFFFLSICCMGLEADGLPRHRQELGAPDEGIIAGKDFLDIIMNASRFHHRHFRRSTTIPNLIPSPSTSTSTSSTSTFSTSTSPTSTSSITEISSTRAAPSTKRIPSSKKPATKPTQGVAKGPMDTPSVIRQTRSTPFYPGQGQHPHTEHPTVRFLSKLLPLEEKLEYNNDLEMVSGGRDISVKESSDSLVMDLPRETMVVAVSVSSSSRAEASTQIPQVASTVKEVKPLIAEANKSDFVVEESEPITTNNDGNFPANVQALPSPNLSQDFLPQGTLTPFQETVIYHNSEGSPRGRAVSFSSVIQGDATTLPPPLERQERHYESSLSNYNNYYEEQEKNETSGDKGPMQESKDYYVTTKYNPSDYNESIDKKGKSMTISEGNWNNFGPQHKQYNPHPRLPLLPATYGQPEQNYEVDESVSVMTNGRAHGIQQNQARNPQNKPNKKDDNQKVGYVVEGRNFRKYRVEERTSDGFIVGEYGVVSHDDGSLRGVRYTADGTINPRLIYDALMKFLAL